jgi:hypothetical protein
MKNEKFCGAMLRLKEATYYELRKIALDNRSTFNKFAGEILEHYVAARSTGKRRSQANEDLEVHRGD